MGTFWKLFECKYKPKSEKKEFDARQKVPDIEHLRAVLGDPWKAQMAHAWLSYSFSNLGFARLIKFTNNHNGKLLNQNMS